MSTNIDYLEERLNSGSNDRLVEVFSSEIKGVGLKSARILVPGDSVLTETAFCHLLSSKERGKRCDFCFLDSNKLLRCSKCKFMYYCSVSCQHQDWGMHKQECKCILKVEPEVPPDVCLLASRLMVKLATLEPKEKASKHIRMTENLRNIVKKESSVYAKGKEMLFTFACILHHFIDAKLARAFSIRKPEDCLRILGWLTCNFFSILSDEITNMASIGKLWQDTCIKGLEELRNRVRK